MKRSTAALCGFSRILFAAAAFCWAFYFLVVITEPGEVSLSAAVPILCLAVSYCAGIAASVKRARVPVYILIQASICAAGIAGLQLALKSGPDAFNLRLVASIALAVSMAVCAVAAASEIRPSQIARRFDVGLLLFAVLILADHYLKGSTADPRLPFLRQRC